MTRKTITPTQKRWKELATTIPDEHLAAEYDRRLALRMAEIANVPDDVLAAEYARRMERKEPDSLLSPFRPRKAWDESMWIK